MRFKTKENDSDSSAPKQTETLVPGASLITENLTDTVLSHESNGGGLSINSENTSNNSTNLSSSNEITVEFKKHPIL